MSPDHVIIVGAGLGGPALAIALAKQSIRSTILERRAGCEDIGGVITLGANAMRVMDKVVDLGPRLREVGQTFDQIQLFTQGTSGLQEAGSFTVKDAETRGLCVMRPTLHEMLLDRCEKWKGMIDLRYGASVKDVEEDEDGVTAVLEDGSRIQGELRVYT